MELKETTAERKIKQLRKRIWGIQGGQGAGKTFSILNIISDYAFKIPNQEIYIASAELTKMRITVIKDFKKIMQAKNMFDSKRFLGDTLYKFQNGSFVKFIGLDKEDIGKGLRSDLVFLNEANKSSFETYRELTSRAKRVIVDFNPNEKFWFHKEVQQRKDCDFIKLTYKDNECIPISEKKEILSYKTKGYNEDGTILNEYWANKWKIYGLGEIGGVEGRIFTWKKKSYLDYLKIDVPVVFGVDWGTSDPFAIIEAKYYDGELYVHELNYKSENEWRQTLSTTENAQIKAKEGDGFVTWMFNKLAINQGAYVVCDNNRQNKIISIRNAGWDYALGISKPKGSIVDGIDTLQNLNVYYTDKSENIEFEQEHYRWDEDRYGTRLEKPVDANNHCMDAIRYVAMFLQSQGVIKAA